MDIPDRTKIAKRLLGQYGLTVEQFEAMYLDQNGLCAVCGKRMTDRDCHVDHDHNSKEKSLRQQVRGLLCSNCNTGLGMFKDSVRLLALAIVYLEAHGKEFE